MEQVYYSEPSENDGYNVVRHNEEDDLSRLFFVWSYRDCQNKFWLMSVKENRVGKNYSASSYSIIFPNRVIYLYSIHCFFSQSVQFSWF